MMTRRVDEADLIAEVERDPLNRMRVYRLATELLNNSWDDVVVLRESGLALIAEQLYRSVGSISANLAEGYSRNSGRDRARYFEYALGSARESIEWYRAASPVIGDEIHRERLGPLLEMRKMLIFIIPRARAQKVGI